MLSAVIKAELSGLGGKIFDEVIKNKPNYNLYNPKLALFHPFADGYDFGYRLASLVAPVFLPLDFIGKMLWDLGVNFKDFCLLKQSFKDFFGVSLLFMGTIAMFAVALPLILLVNAVDFLGSLFTTLCYNRSDENDPLLTMPSLQFKRD